ncbi:MFS transporter [Salinadaptatus halalkaliphilus]|uniref:MFS transporter n=1 Tax=Salinadaptatus halalkaliphilus TaxID=2419781 RepID=A0A4S3TIT6_9EURY|nr:MFS transporter [Salinadaptatus halalkaliphilus]THE62765.1 MFS transporter [Salinadaptatus halalkaliphilus]
MSPQSAGDDGLFRKLALAIGFLAVAASALLAHASPATGYEISIYAMTPSGVWAGLFVAMAVALAVAFVPAPDDRYGTRAIALVLGGSGMIVFAGLPIIRGYHYFGHHDSLTHLGWARAISEGTITPFDLFYPAIHTVTVVLNTVLELPLTRALLVVVLVSMLVFCLFVPLTVGTITDDRQAVLVATFSSFLLLPITTISMYLSAHAMSQAVLFSALLVYCFVTYLRTDRSVGTVSAIGLAFALVSVAAVVYHPQLVAHLIVVFLGICAVQFLARRVARNGQIADQTPVYGHSLFLVALFLIWTADDGFFLETVEYFLSSVVEFLLGMGGTAGDTIATQGASLTAVGGSLPEIFLKLFATHLVFTLLVGALALGLVVARHSAWLSSVRAETTYFLVALAALGPVFVAYFFASGSSMYFRVFGLMMVFVTILGSIAIAGLVARLSRRPIDDDSGRPTDAGRTVSGHPLLAVAFALLLVVSLAAVFPSPYTYTPSPHVSEQTMHGYDSAFAAQDDDVDFLGLRDGPNRFDDAVNGNAERSWRHIDIEAEDLRDGLPDAYDEDRYLAVTQKDYEREVVAYHELRYSEGELESIGAEPGVDRIQSNGEFDLYYVHGEPDGV